MRKTKTKEIIVLFGTSSKGKSSTLIALIEELTGKPLPTSRSKDVRVLIPRYKAKVQGAKKEINISICTCGDIAEIIEDNIRFFRGEMPDDKSVDVFIFDKKANDYVAVTDATQLRLNASDLCISACRTQGVVVDAMQYFVNYNLSNVFSALWIRFEKLRQKILGRDWAKRKAPSFIPIASELRSIKISFIQ